LRQRADGAFDDILVPGTLPLFYSLPASLVPCGGMVCPPPVTQSGDFSRGHALARAGDGTLWLATVRDHVDRSAHYEEDGIGDACQCWAKTVPADDRSSATLVVQRIRPEDAAPSSILWSLDLGLRPWTSYTVDIETLSASFAASLLYLAILSPDNDVHYFALDTAELG
jgi:hypothetical protein